MSRDDVIFYSQKYGPEAAAFLLLLCGPDDFSGSMEDYNTLMKEMEEADA